MVDRGRDSLLLPLVGAGQHHRAPGPGVSAVSAHLNRLSHTRRRLKWVGSVACLAAVSVWCYSFFNAVCAFNETSALYLGSGRVSVACTPIRAPGSASASSMFSDVRRLRGPLWQRLGLELPEIQAAHIQGDFRLRLSLPLWVVVSLLVVPTVILWYRDRPPPKGHCRDCGYDLRGNESGVCPECGATASSQSAAGLSHRNAMRSKADDQPDDAARTECNKAQTRVS